MTEQELRVLVRQAIARHAATAGRALSDPASGVLLDAAGQAPLDPASTRRHASHGVFRLPSGGDTEGPCLIEPTVACNHCGYCKSLGH